MSEMVERVARALCEQSLAVAGNEPDDLTQAITDRRWNLFEPQARAAIEAMREPTEDMMKAMQESGVFDEVNGMISLCHARGTHPGGLKKPPMPAAYTIMIDAALK